VKTNLLSAAKHLHLLAFAGALIGCDKPATPPTTVVTAADSADQVMFGARSLITEKGLLRAELLADTALFFDENTRVELRGVNTTFHNSTGAKATTLTSLRGTYDTRRAGMEARGNVIVVSVDGRRLSTEHLHYDATNDEISSDSAFVLTEPGRRLEGIGFRSDPGMQNFRILRGAKGSAGTVTVPAT
jgi:LPS export ABC transporter protein LptC